MEEQLDFDGLLHVSKPHFIPPLHKSFTPAALVNRNFLNYVNTSKHGVPLVIGLERGDQSISVYRTQCLDEGSESAALNLPYAERLLKMLLWQRGGWRVMVGGPHSVGEHLKRVYSQAGARAFDAEFMGSVFEHPFTVDITGAEKVPAPNEGTVRLGGHLEGCRIGFDLGASDRKVAAVKDGDAVYTEEVVWDPRNATDPRYHFDQIDAALKSAAGHLSRVDAVGGSAAGIYINNRPRVGSLYRGIPQPLFDTQTRNLFFDLQKAWNGIPFAVVNDGEVTALAGAMSLNDAAVLGMALGSSEAGGYVTPTGELTTWLNELAFCRWILTRRVRWMSGRATAEWGPIISRSRPSSGWRRWQALRLIPIWVSRPAQIRAGTAGSGDERARLIFETIGYYVGYGVAHYADFYELRHVLILGRVTSGEAATSFWRAPRKC